MGFVCAARALTGSCIENSQSRKTMGKHLKTKRQCLTVESSTTCCFMFQIFSRLAISIKKFLRKQITQIISRSVRGILHYYYYAAWNISPRQLHDEKNPDWLDANFKTNFSPKTIIFIWVRWVHNALHNYLTLLKKVLFHVGRAKSFFCLVSKAAHQTDNKGFEPCPSTTWNRNFASKCQLHDIGRSTF